MLATLLVHVPLAIFPLLQLPQPPGQCELDVLTPLALEERTLAQFNADIDAYVVLHRRIARTLPPSEMFDDEDPFFEAELRRAIVAARPESRPGGFFTPRVADIFRQHIDHAVAYSGGFGVAHPHDLFSGARVAVNQPLPYLPDRLEWAAVVTALPPVPGELRYVFWGRDLALVDAGANLVLDVLTDALPQWAGSDVIYR